MPLYAYRHARIVVLNARTTASEAARAMRTNEVGAVVVTDHDEIVGIVTDRDLALRVVGEGLDPRATRLGEIMSPRVAVLGPEADERDALRLMTELRLRRVPIVEDGRVVGMVTLDDLVLEGTATFDDVRAVVAAQIVEAGPARTHRFDEWRALERRYGRAQRTWSELVLGVQAASGLAERADAERAVEVVLEGVVRRIEPAVAKRLMARLPALVLSRLHALPDGPDASISRPRIERDVAKALGVGPARSAKIVAAVFGALVPSVRATDAVGRLLPADLRALLVPADSVGRAKPRRAAERRVARHHVHE